MSTSGCVILTRLPSTARTCVYENLLFQNFVQEDSLQIPTHKGAPLALEGLLKLT